MAVSDFFAGEIATELLKMLIYITRKACLCRPHAERLILTINELLPIITDINHSGVELTATSQHQLDAISRSLTDGHDLAVKVLNSSRWNVYQNLQLSRKMEKLEKKISRFVQGPLHAHVLAGVRHVRKRKVEDMVVDRGDVIVVAGEVCRDDDDVKDLHQKVMPSFEELNDYLQIPLQDIRSATNNFSNENRIGLGGFGKVYKGESEKHGIIAVKRWDCDRGKSGHGDHEFRTEIRLLSIYKHENIASFRGFCDEKGEKILVYKYEINGSLDKHLRNKDLSWVQRLRICLDAARGLMYLHDGVGFEDNILHRDVKSANILLDEDWKAKISDFGLSRNGPAQSSFVISNSCGTLGYIDPEYITTGHLTQKSDIFSFGVVLFEVMCGMPAFSKVDGQFFNVWVQKHYKRQTLDKIIYSDLHEEINPASLHVFSTVAYQCLRNGEERPTMKMVVEQLQKALDHQAPKGPWTDVYDDFTDEDDALCRRQTSYLEHDTFLSFCGQDTKNTFAEHLHSALVNQGLNMHDLRRPLVETTSSPMHKAIKESMMVTILLSKDYVNSTWCLNELECIMKCKKEAGLNVIPVFYDVDPAELCRQNGRHGAAFFAHELQNNEKVESWRKALVDAANIPGYVVTGDEDEAEAVERISYSITHRYLSLLSSEEVTAGTGGGSNLIGIETRMQELSSLLEIGSGGVRMVGVTGGWGSGKSTLASSIYDEINHEFEGCCFVKNVRAESRKHGLKTLQEKILSDVFKSKVTLRSIEQGISVMRRTLCQTKVLLVLDDVDHIDHLRMLAGSPSWFGDRSRIIVTTRNQDLVNAHNCTTHNVRMLDVDEALELFSCHAFAETRPAEGYEALSRSMVSKFGGHPSALISLGSFLRDKDLIDWTSALARLDGIPVEEILDKFDTGDDGLCRNTFSWFAT